MSSDDTPTSADSGTTEPQASAPATELKPAPTDTGWLQVESLRASGQPVEVRFKADRADD